MPQQSHRGDINDTAWRNQQIAAGTENYLIDGGGVSIGDSPTSVETVLETSVFRFDSEIVTADQQTVSHADGDPNDPRIDAIVVDETGSAESIEGTAASATPPDRRFPHVKQPAPPELYRGAGDNGYVCVAFLWVPAGTGGSEGLYNDYLTDRRMPGTAFNDLSLIPGRDLQYQIDTAREGQTLEGDRSQTIVLDQPLTVGTKDLTICNLSLQYGAGTATSDTDDMLTLAADGVTIESVTLDGNKSGQRADADGISIKASNCAVSDLRADRMPGHVINLNGSSVGVKNTIIDNVEGRRHNKSVVMTQGAGVYRARISSVYGFNGANPGGSSLALRGGSTWVTANDIYGEDQARVVNLSDYGPQSPPMVSNTLSNIRGARVNRLVPNQTSEKVAHRGLVLDTLYGRDFAPGGGGGIVDIGNFHGVRVQNAFLVNNYEGAYAIHGRNINRVTVQNCSLRNKDGRRGAIALMDADLVAATGNIVVPANPGEMKYGVNARALDGKHGFIFVNNNIFGQGLETAIQFAQDKGANLTNIMAKNNRATNIVNETDAAKGNMIIKDNL